MNSRKKFIGTIVVLIFLAGIILGMISFLGNYFK